MAFRVEIQPQAFDDLDAIADYIRSRRSLDVAQRWFNSIILDIGTLKEMPSRCSVAPESDELDREIRVLLHGRKNRTYKVYFAIDHITPSSGIVHVVHVRHWARKPLTDDELQELIDDQDEQP